VNSPDEIRPGNDPSGPNIPTMQKNVEKTYQTIPNIS
jgi:hypothetical protein